VGNSQLRECAAPLIKGAFGTTIVSVDQGYIANGSAVRQLDAVIEHI
jgi:hypothetical protein